MAAYNTFPSYNPYSAYPANSYQQQYSQTYTPQTNNAYASAPQTSGIVWVDGEVGAKAYQLPVGWPANAPMPLWDTNDTVIYLKSINQMGMPNPLQKVHYTMEDTPKTAPAMSHQTALPSNDQHNAQDMSEYVRKDELNQIKEELKAAIHSISDEMKGAKRDGKPAV